MKYLLIILIPIISGCSTNKIYNNIITNINNVLTTNNTNGYLRSLSAKQFNIEMFKKLNTKNNNDTLFFITKIYDVGPSNCYMICNNKDTIIYCEKDFDPIMPYCHNCIKEMVSINEKDCRHCRKEVFFINENERRIISSWDIAEIERRNLLWDSLKYDPDYGLCGGSTKFVIRHIVNNNKNDFQWFVIPESSIMEDY